MNGDVIGNAQYLLIVSVEVVHQLRNLVGAQSEQAHIIVERNQVLLVISLALIHELQYPSLLLHIFHLLFISCRLF